MQTLTRTLHSYGDGSYQAKLFEDLSPKHAAYMDPLTWRNIEKRSGGLPSARPQRRGEVEKKMSSQRAFEDNGGMKLAASPRDWENSSPCGTLTSN